MKRGLIVLLLFFAQLFLLFRGAVYFGKYCNPFLLAIISFALPLPYLNGLLGSRPSPNPALRRVNWHSAIITLLGLIYCAYLLQGAFQRIPDPGKFSDVLPQINALYNRFIDGQQPYYPLPLVGYAPFPVYMPMHWLPIGMSYLMDFDIRWAGFIFFAFASLYYAIQRRDSIGSVVSGLLPVIVLYSFTKYAGNDMFVTLETIVAAYYLLLAAGLGKKSLFIIVAGIICCLLSRYTMIFWLPLFGILLWKYQPHRISYIIWGIVLLSVLAIYIVPFLLRDPSILREGVMYHNKAAIDDWHGYGNPPVSWTHESAVSFGACMKAVLPGDAAHQVAIVRVIQATLMVGLVIGGYFYYTKRKQQIDIYNFSLVANKR